MHSFEQKSNIRRKKAQANRREVEPSEASTDSHSRQHDAKRLVQWSRVRNQALLKKQRMTNVGVLAVIGVALANGAQSAATARRPAMTNPYVLGIGISMAAESLAALAYYYFFT